MFKRIILALALVLALTGCVNPSVNQSQQTPALTPAQASFNAAATHATYRWQTYAWSGHKWSAKANLLQHNEWGQSLDHPGKTLVVDTTGDIPASWFASHRNVIGVIFYVPGAGGSWKWPSVAGVKSLRAHGVKIGWVWEAGASAISGGYSAGQRAARTFLATAVVLEAPGVDRIGGAAVVEAFVDHYLAAASSAAWARYREGKAYDAEAEGRQVAVGMLHQLDVTLAAA